MGLLAQSLCVLLLSPELVQGASIVELGVSCVDALDDLLEPGLLLEQLLGAVALVPQARIGYLRVQLLEPLALGVVVKDTPAARRCAL